MIAIYINSKSDLICSHPSIGIVRPPCISLMIPIYISSKSDLICSHPSIGVVRPPPSITVIITIIMVADTISWRDSVDVFRMARAKAMAPLSPT